MKQRHVLGIFMCCYLAIILLAWCAEFVAATSKTPKETFRGKPPADNLHHSRNDGTKHIHNLHSDTKDGKASTKNTPENSTPLSFPWNKDRAMKSAGKLMIALVFGQMVTPPSDPWLLLNEMILPKGTFDLEKYPLTDKEKNTLRSDVWRSFLENVAFNPFPMTTKNLTDFINLLNNTNKNPDTISSQVACNQENVQSSEHVSAKSFSTDKKPHLVPYRAPKGHINIEKDVNDIRLKSCDDLLEIRDRFYKDKEQLYDKINIHIQGSIAKFDKLLEDSFKPKFHEFINFMEALKKVESDFCTILAMVGNLLTLSSRLMVSAASDAFRDLKKEALKSDKNINEIIRVLVAPSAETFGQMITLLNENTDLFDTSVQCNICKLFVMCADLLLPLNMFKSVVLLLLYKIQVVEIVYKILDRFGTNKSLNSQKYELLVRELKAISNKLTKAKMIADEMNKFVEPHLTSPRDPKHEQKAHTNKSN